MARAPTSEAERNLALGYRSCVELCAAEPHSTDRCVPRGKEGEDGLESSSAHL